MQVKGFLITGLAFLLCMVMVVAANYVIYSRGIVQSADYEKMSIDKVNNRAVDTYRIIDDIATTYPEEECDNIKVKINAALAQAKVLMSQERISLSYSMLSAVSEDKTCSVKFYYSLESNGFFKEMNYDKLFNSD